MTTASTVPRTTIETAAASSRGPAPASAWTGGQWSLFRAVLGLFVLVHGLRLVPWAGELFAAGGVLGDPTLSPFTQLWPNPLAWIGAEWFALLWVASLIPAGFALALGWRDRAAALWCWFALACCFGRTPLIANPSLPFIGWLLLLHACLPRAPYLSWAARGRLDPDGGWRLDRRFQIALWTVVAVGYSVSGWYKLQSPSWIDGSALQRVLANPLARDTPLRDMLLSLPDGLLQFATWGALALELAFAPLALSRRLRPWLWIAAVLMHLGILATVAFSELTLGMLVVHLAMVDPRWLAPQSASAGSLVGYDGSCGLCHRWVRLILAEDRAGHFVFAALDGPHVAEALAESGHRRDQLPDTLVLFRSDGSLALRSDAVIGILHGLGGLWRAIAWLLQLVPRPVRDAGYRLVAATRHRLAPAPESACPLLPSSLRARFVDHQAARAPR